MLAMKSSVFEDITLCRQLNGLNRIEDGGDIFVQNIGLLLADFKAVCPRR